MYSVSTRYCKAQLAIESRPGKLMLTMKFKSITLKYSLGYNLSLYQDSTSIALLILIDEVIES